MARPGPRPRAARALSVALLVPAAALGVASAVPAGAAEEESAPQLSLPEDAPRLDADDPGAPAALPAGWSRAELGPSDGPGEALHLSYRRQVEGSTVHVAATTPGSAPGAADGFRLEISAPDGDSCASDSIVRYDGGGVGLLTLGLAAGPGDPREEDPSAAPCAETTSVRVTVERSAPVVDTSSPVWLRVVEEAPVGDTDDLPAPADAPDPGPVDVDGAARAQEGSTDVTTAPVLTTGIWRGTVRVGGQTAYRVRLGWGQSVAVEAVADGLDEDALDEAGAGVGLGVRILDPMLAQRATTVDSTLGSDVTTAYAELPAVGYLQRHEAGGPSLPGEHVVVVTSDPGYDGEATAYPVPVTLRVAVAGPADAAGPAYASEPAFLLGEDQLSDEVTLSGDGAGASVARLVTGGALLALGLGSLAGGVVLLRRRGRQAVRSR
ncbi:hypothetical protein [Nocardioides sp. ChNu-99]|uniref:hypothetical protein n=1 Tax=Nocardioides sp. ChNu-99 TaxID=2839897 RepID=UPI002406622F|nr:hypothetical protein [Nocardioides sp. ChNu-99]MDF9717942.1 hypothetical protein [Nocardioides sp. ChNu-99]